jgi:phosphomevalonate kinase
VRVIAPGKLVLTGAYAVLEGAPAIVVAVDRYAVVDTREPGKVDVRALYTNPTGAGPSAGAEGLGQKLGLGSSAASMVALFGARALLRGDDPRHAAVRADIFRGVRDAHQREQGGGSGVDVAASVHGGTLRYRVVRDRAGKASEAKMDAVGLPAGLEISAFWSGSSARTSDLLSRVDGLRARGGAAAVFTALREVAEEAADAVVVAARFVRAAAAFGRALAALGDAADAPIVLPPFAELGALAEREDAAFLPSGAGGGDCGVWLGLAPPSAGFRARALALGLSPLNLAVDHGGVRPESPS